MFKYDLYIKSLGNFMVKANYTSKPLPDVKLHNEKQDGVFIKTGNYEPDEKIVNLYINGRHPKDVLRSYAHELIHHKQNLDGRLNGDAYNGTEITKDDKLIKLEEEAYLKGNIAFRSWTETVDKKKENLQEKKIIRFSQSQIQMFLNEDLKSPKLSKMAKEHGGFSKYADNGNSAYTRGGCREVPLSDITDDMIEDEPVEPIRYSTDLHGTPKYPVPDTNVTKHGIEFNDGYTLPFKKDNEDVYRLADEYKDGKRKERHYGKTSKYNDGQVSYQPPTERASSARQMREAIMLCKSAIRHYEDLQKQRPLTRYERDRYYDEKAHLNRLYNEIQRRKNEGEWTDRKLY